MSAQSLLFKNFTSEYTIVIPDQPTEWEMKAASEMQQYIKISSSISLPIRIENQIVYTKAIYIGKTAKAQQILKNIEQIKNDGFIKYCDGNDLYIYGINGKAVLYGVYDFLEAQLGCRLYTPEDLYIPKYEQFVLPKLNELNNPSFSYREILYRYPNQSELYKDWYHIHNRKDLEKNWGMFVHTFKDLIPAEYYFDSHPEWFSEIKNKRVRDGQLCLSNPEVLEELCNNLKKKIDANPNATYWSVSNNDNMNNCTCKNCHALDSLYGAPSGTLLFFVNQIAQRFPEKQISTLAYQYTRKYPERFIKPEKNVNIMFCSIECGREKPIEKNPNEQSFVKDMEGWKNLTNNIFLWDYVVQFKNMLNPFPNLHVLQPNLQFFHKNDVQMMFEQGTGEVNKTSWMELRTYMISKLLWNVNADMDQLTDDFISSYYEKAAPYIKQYYLLNEQAVIQSDKRLDIYGFPIDGIETYLSPTLISMYDSLFTLAYQTEEDISVRNRIRFLELSHDFAKIELSMNEVTPELSFFTLENGKKIIKIEMIELLNRFVKDCEIFGIKNLEEHGYSPNEFKENVFHFIDKSTTENLAKEGKITLKSTFSDQYNEGGAESLIDGNYGILNYKYNWLGFLHQDFEAIVDLEQPKKINQISIDFFSYPLSWIFVPENVEFYISNDEVQWKQVYNTTYKNMEILTKASIQNFKKEHIDQEARFIKVIARAIKTNPEWHRGAGQPCWVFTDEIIVK